MVGNVRVPFLCNAEVHARFLLALPLLVFAELVIHRRTRLVVGQFVARNLIAAEDMPRVKAAVGSALRLRNSLAVELLLIVLVYGVGLRVRSYLAVDAGTWVARGAEGVGSGFGNLSLAGWWHMLVSVPLYQFLLVRWYFRLALWTRFLWQISRIDLKLMPSHPDRVGGLGFLGNIVYAFTPLLVAHGVLLAGFVADRIFFQGAKLPEFTVEIVGGVGVPCSSCSARSWCSRVNLRVPGAPVSVIRCAGAALRERVRCEVAARRPGPGRTARWQPRHPIPGGSGQQFRSGPDHAIRPVLEGHGHSAGYRHARTAPAADADDDLLEELLKRLLGAVF